MTKSQQTAMYCMLSNRLEKKSTVTKTYQYKLNFKTNLHKIKLKEMI